MGSQSDEIKSYNKNKIIRELSGELKGIFNLAKVNKIENFSKIKDKRCFIHKKHTGKHICFDEHYEPDADILINDCKLNSLGMIFVFCGDDTDPESYPDFLMKCIDKAGYLRHLFLRNAGGKEKVQARCVELVIVCPKKSKKEFGSKLREIARETEYLFSVGVNLLTILEPGKRTAPEGKHFRGKDLERAFSWLLKKTGEWYTTIKSSSNTKLEIITLDNYRLPGKRILELNTDSEIHLIHGPNGSGKSTIVEALEMAVTGKAERVERLEINPDYKKIIKNKHVGTEAQVLLEFKEKEEKEKKKFSIKQEGISTPLAKEIKATSFRLNQSVMERLTREGDGGRANVFIDAFFPEHREVVQEHNIAKSKAGQCFEELPQKLKEAITGQDRNREEAVIDSLGVLKSENKPVELIEACLPVSIELLDQLIPFAAQLHGLPEKLKSGIINETILSQVDSALDQIQEGIDSILINLRDARELFEQLNQWYAVPRSAPNFKATLDKWMEMTALTDLAEKYYIVVKSLKGARDQKWKLDEDSRKVFGEHLFEVNDEIIKGKIEIFASKRDELRTSLEPSESHEKQKGETVPIQPIFGRYEMDRLNRAAPWLTETSGLGDRIKDALTENRVLKFDKSLTIGVKNWAAGLIEKTGELIAACEEIKDKGKFEKTCVDRFENLKKTLDAHIELKKIGETLHTTFIELLKKQKKGNLIESLNELMDLFTPARWAYEELAIRHEYTEKEHKLHFEIDEPGGLSGRKARADLRLNTAELNMFALSLFILCAVRIDNPLSLLILDDPLQNMDEITVTTLARGFNKLLKLFPKNWQIIMLFHGEEDLERFRREVPAAVYSLPWLSPSQEAEKKIVRYDVIKSQVSAELQLLSKLVGIKAG
ncbi:MAG: AAA family ATPase [Candidatus Aminicenantes bacterium]|nr:AAA family ATPase [Candidatus Aminicenantes bacterium]